MTRSSCSSRALVFARASVLGLLGSGTACGHALPAAPPRAPSVAVSSPIETAPPVPVLAMAPRADLDGLDAYIQSAMAAWKSPGVAIAVVQDGKVVFIKGYGLRDVEKKLPVTPKTLFEIGSITKSFTVTALGSLVDEGKLDWDKPVRDYLPGFKMYSDDATEHLTLRDMLCHRSGLPRHDMAWYGSPLGRKEIIDRLRFLEPSKQLRETFQYNNLMFMTAGYIGGQVAGSPSWEAFVKTRVLDRLGMRGTRLSAEEAQQAPDFSMPYRTAKDLVKRIPFRHQGAIAPAGSINAGVEDMARYLVMQMSLGKLGDLRVLSEAVAREMQSPQIVTASAGKWPELSAAGYGLGLSTGFYRGKRYVRHNGGIDGFTAALAFLPDDKVGVVVLGNLDGSELPEALAFDVFDRVLGLTPTGWSQRYLDDKKGLEKAEEDAKARGFSPRKQGTKPTHDLAEYAAEYEHPGYGIAKIEIKDGALALTFNGEQHPLGHYHYDVFEVPPNPLDPLEKTKASFGMDLDGDIDHVSILLEPTVKPIEFARLPDARMSTKAILAPFVGTYELGPVVGVIAFKGDRTLTWQQSGGPVFDLVPLRGAIFALKGRADVRIEFKRDPSGAVNEAALYTGDGNYVVKKKKP